MFQRVCRAAGRGHSLRLSGVGGVLASCGTGARPSPAEGDASLLSRTVGWPEDKSPAGAGRYMNGWALYQPWPAGSWRFTSDIPERRRTVSGTSCRTRRIFCSWPLSWAGSALPSPARTSTGRRRHALVARGRARPGREDPLLGRPYIWLPWAVCEYLDATGDDSL